MRIKLPCGVYVKTIGQVRGQHAVRLEYDGDKSDTIVAWTQGSHKEFADLNFKMKQVTTRENLLPFARFLRQLHKEMGIRPKKSR